jgi:Leucine-rich repeat (LRR) protein
LIIYCDHLSRLEVLLANDAQLGSLPTTMGDLKHLRVLDVSGNRLGAIPVEISTIESLAKLRFKRKEGLLSLL